MRLGALLQSTCESFLLEAYPESLETLGKVLTVEVVGHLKSLVAQYLLYRQDDVTLESVLSLTFAMFAFHFKRPGSEKPLHLEVSEVKLGPG